MSLSSSSPVLLAATSPLPSTAEGASGKGAVLGPASLSLSEDDILALTGEETLDDVKELEVIFNSVQNLGGALKKCTRLRAITLIDTNLKSVSMSATRPVGYTNSLLSLSLTRQDLSSMGELFLPNLKELMLNHNKIARIENLDGCPKLQRLWLCHNKIKVIENLHPLGDLRELWLQCNEIRVVSGLDHTGALRTLNLAGNKISDFKDLQRLGSLPNLKDLRLQDDVFGSCPVARSEGYRNFVLCVAKQLLSLDGVELNLGDRRAAEDEYMQRVLDFNDEIDMLRREHEDHLLAIEARQKRNVGHSDTLQKELMVAFRELDDVVTKGRASIVAEQQRQLAVRSSNASRLKKRIAKCRDDYATIIEQRIQEEQRLLQEEEAAFETVKREAKWELEESLLLSELKFAPSSGKENIHSVAVQTIKGDNVSSHSAEMRNLAIQISSVQTRVVDVSAVRIAPSSLAPEETATNTNVVSLFSKTCRCLRLHSASKIANAYLFKQHKMRLGELAKSDMLLRRDGGGITAEKLFVCVTAPKHVKELLTSGFKDWQRSRPGDDEGILLFSDPRLAVCAAKYREGQEHASGGNGYPNRHRIVCCHVTLGRVRPLRVTSSTPLLDPSALLSLIPPDEIAAQIAYSFPDEDNAGEISGSIYAVRRSFSSVILPENYMVLCEDDSKSQDESKDSFSWRDMIDTSPTASQGIQLILKKSTSALGSFDAAQNFDDMGKHMAMLSGDAEAKLIALEKRALNEFKQYQNRVLTELDPVEADKIENEEREVRRLEGILKALRGQIDDEKANQERILHEFQGSGHKRR